MASRRRGQSLGGRYRSQPRDPVTGKRLNLRGQTLAEIETRMARVDRVKDALQFKEITIRQAGAELRPTVGMAIPLRELWKRFERGVPKQSAEIAASVWKNRLEPWFGEATLYDLTETRMREWLAALEKKRLANGKRGYSPGSRRAAWDFLRGCVGLAYRDGMISEYPWGGFTVPDPKHPEHERESLRDPEELLALLRAARAEDEKKSKHWADGVFAPIAFLALTGLRQAEAAGLAWTDVDLERSPHFLRVRRQAVPNWPKVEGQNKRPAMRPKNGPREQELHPDVERLLRARRALLQARNRYREDGPVWPAPASSSWRTSGKIVWPAAVRRIVKASGLPNVEAWVVHSLRHSFARLELVGHGGDLRTVALRTGHHDLSTLEGYLRKPSRIAGGSRIPDLPLGLGPPAIEVHSLEAPAASRTAIVVAAGENCDPRSAEEGLTLPAGTWVDEALAWIANGSRGKRPAHVTSEIKAAYARAYKRAIRDRPGAIIPAREAASRARRAALGAWGKSLALARLRILDGAK